MEPIIPASTGDTPTFHTTKPTFPFSTVLTKGLLVSSIALLVACGGGGGGSSSSTTDIDTDEDTIVDSADNCVDVANEDQLDFDGDGIGDACDTDDDNDGVTDDIDGFPFIAIGALTDTDNDGSPDECDEACEALGMTADDDDDNDGVSDENDAFIKISLGDLADSDGDGVPNDCDEACKALGMIADADDDDDGLDDEYDGFPLIAIGDLADNDTDGKPDDCDQACTDLGMTADDDDDNDGVTDENDGFRFIAIGGLTDTDSDGRPNDCDEACIELGMTADDDDDGDQVKDDTDNCRVTSNPVQSETNAQLDSDEDGYGDACDLAINDSNLAHVDLNRLIERGVFLTTFEGEDVLDMLGQLGHVSNIGDVNNGGKDDLGLVILGSDAFTSTDGTDLDIFIGDVYIYVLYGEQTFPETIRKSDLDNLEGFKFKTYSHYENIFDAFGSERKVRYGVMPIGDFNNDGIDDFALVDEFMPYESEVDGIRPGNSVTYLIYGHDDTNPWPSMDNPIDTSEIGEKYGMYHVNRIIDPSTNRNWFNMYGFHNIVPAGDMDGDGLEDIILGQTHSLYKQNQATFRYSNYLFFGQETADTPYGQLPFLAYSYPEEPDDNHHTFIIFSNDSIVYSGVVDQGSILEKAGNVLEWENGEGLEDLLYVNQSFGKDWYDDEADRIGGVFLVPGRSSYRPADTRRVRVNEESFDSIGIRGEISETDGHIIVGGSATAGHDINDDGHPDVLFTVSTTGGDNNANTLKLYLLKGGLSEDDFPSRQMTFTEAKSSLTQSGVLQEIDLPDMDALHQPRLELIEDINGDGIADLLIGSPMYADEDNEGNVDAISNKGAVWILYGGENFGEGLNIKELTPDQGLYIYNASGYNHLIDSTDGNYVWHGDGFGFDVNTMADLNGDDQPEIYMTAPFWDNADNLVDDKGPIRKNGAGRVFVFPSGFDFYSNETPNNSTSNNPE